VLNNRSVGHQCSARAVDNATVRFADYRPLVDAWALYDNAGMQPQLLDWGVTA